MINKFINRKQSYRCVFIIGCPRSGKTLLQRLIAWHKDFAWFSQYNQISILGLINRIYDLPLIGEWLMNFRLCKFFPKPGEMRKDYVKILITNGSLNQTQVTEQDKEKLISIAKKQLSHQKKNKLITDYGRPARILYFNKIFPNSKFIHVIRDGREVTADLLQNRSQWFDIKKDLHSFYQQVPEELDQQLMQNQTHHQLALAALRWKMAILEIEKQSLKLQPNQYLVIKYEDLLKDKCQVIENVLNFLNLEWTARLKKVVSCMKIKKSINWQDYFNQQEIKILNNLLQDILIKYHYQI